MPEEIADGGNSRASGVDFEGRGSRDLRWPKADWQFCASEIQKRTSEIA